MTKATTDLNEGIWDAVKTKASQIGNAAMANLGSNTASGKLRTSQVSTNLYSGYKKSVGIGGGAHTEFGMKRFLDLSAVTNDEFNKRWAKNFATYIGLPKEGREKFINTYNLAKDSDLVLTGGVKDNPNPVSDKQAANPDPNVAISLTGGGYQQNKDMYDAIPLEVKGDIITHVQSHKWDKISQDGEYVWNKIVDGSFICAKDQESLTLIREIFDSAGTPKDLMKRFYDAGVLSNADRFVRIAKSKYPGNPKAILRDSLMTSVMRLGFNYHSMVNRYVLCMPEIAMRYMKVPNGSPIHIVEDSDFRDKIRDTIKSVAGKTADITKSAASALKKKAVGDDGVVTDQELRDFFTLLTQSAYYSGYLQESTYDAETIASSILSETTEYIEHLLDETVAADVAVSPVELFKGEDDAPITRRSS